MPLLRSVVSSLLLITSAALYAEDGGGGEGDGTETLTEYLQNLGAYLGFDITKELKDPLATLIDASSTTLAQQYSFVTLLGAIPVNTYSEALAYFVPSNTENYSLINDMANYTFEKQPNSGSYSSASTGNSGGISVSTLIDQKNDQGGYQSDPVTQSILNILTTPQTTYCMNNDADAWIDCDFLYDTKIMSQVIGSTPNTTTFFSPSYNAEVVAQLNANTLIAPLLYSTTDNSSSTSSEEGQNTTSDEDGLVAKNQIQEAENFIRYATASVKPISLPKRKAYDDLYAQATYSGDDAASLFQKQLAQEKIAKYLVKLRSFSAVSSVPTATLYSVLSKRMPQAQSADSSKQTSQALSEFKMATRRLYDPSKQGSDNQKQWVDQINEASSATVQKEMAILLSEINYQLYLSRQQDEKALVTMSLLLIQSMNFGTPSLSDASIDIDTDSSD